MQKYAKNYLEYFGYTVADFIPCECCGAKSHDFHHIVPRSKFGKNNKEEQDRVENVMALCRLCHVRYGQNKRYNDFLQELHNKTIEYHK
jgi:5-methylcytosine-specific restriction endonuclease McrA